MMYVVEYDGDEVTTNSVRVVAQLKERKLSKGVHHNGSICNTSMNYDYNQNKVVEAIADAIDEQIKTDKMQLLLHSVGDRDIDTDQLSQAKEGEQQCHEDVAEESFELAWGDVNDCRLDPVKVRQARRAEMEFFKLMQVYRTVPKQRCRDLTGRESIKVRWVDTNKQDEVNPKYRSRLVAKDYKKGSAPQLYTATPLIDALRLLISLAAIGYTSRGQEDVL